MREARSEETPAYIGTSAKFYDGPRKIGNPTLTSGYPFWAFTFRFYVGYQVRMRAPIANYNGHEGTPMLAERPRARRHVFSAHLEMLDVESESKIITRTRDLTLFGFRAEIKNCSWPVGTRVRVKITHKASNFTAGARIVWVRKNTDLGLAFTDVTPRDQLILEKWIAELRGSEVLAHSDSV